MGFPSEKKHPGVEKNGYSHRPAAPDLLLEERAVPPGRTEHRVGYNEHRAYAHHAGES